MSIRVAEGASTPVEYTLQLNPWDRSVFRQLGSLRSKAQS